MLRRLALGLLVTVVACSGGGGSKKAAPAGTTAPPAQRMTLTSSAFGDGTPLPPEFTCNGAGHSPPLAWSGAPPGAASFALVVQDPDASRTFVHWIVYDIPPTVNAISADTTPPAARQGTNTAGSTGYRPPCPPPGSKPHHYVFTIFALPNTVTISETIPAADLVGVIERSAPIATGRLTGTFQRGI